MNGWSNSKQPRKERLLIRTHRLASNNRTDAGASSFRVTLQRLHVSGVITVPIDVSAYARYM